MAEVGTTFVTVAPSAKGFLPKLSSQIGGDVEKAGRTSGSRFGKVFASASMSPLRAIGAAAVGLFAVDKVKDFFATSIDEARESQKVGALTTQVIKSTGGAAQVSAEQVGNLSSAISKKVGIDDEAIQSGANMLLTFTNIRNEVGRGNKIFNQATKITTDMSAALGTDLKNQAIQVGKALNDPIKGVTALQRVGVSFTSQQKDQIKALVNGGHTLDAQKLILRELNKEFGGAAAAQATAGEKMSVAWGNLKEQIGTALLPALDAVENAVTTHVIPAVSDLVTKIGPAFSAVSSFVAPFIAQFQAFFSGSGGTGVASFGSQISTVFNGQILPLVQQAGVVFNTILFPAIQSVASYFSGTLLPAFRQFATIIMTNVIPIFTSLASFVYTQLYPAIAKIVSAVAQNLKPVFDQLVATFRGSVLPALQQLLAKFHEWQPTIQRVIGVVVQVIGKVLEFASAVLGKVLPVAIRFAGFMISKMVPAVLGVITVLFRIIGVVIRVGGAFVDAITHVARFAAAVSKKIGEVIGFVRALPGKITGALGNVGSILLNAGKAIMSGLLDGLTAGFKPVKDFLGGVAGTIKKIKGPLPYDRTILIPAGRAIMQGLDKGLRAGARDVYSNVSSMATKIARALAGGISAGEKKWVTPAIKRLDDAVGKLVDKAKSKVDDLKQQFSSVRDSVAQAFGGDLFSASNTGSFMAGLLKQRGLLGNLLKAQKTLQGWRLDPNFLSALFASGNSNLILGLAAGGKSAAVRDANLYGTVIGQQQSLGVSQANYQFGQQLNVATRQLDRLELIEKNTRDLDKKVARALSQASAKGAKKKKR